MTPVLRNYIEEIVKMFNFTKEQWEYLDGIAEDPLKLYKEQNQQNTPEINE